MPTRDAKRAKVLLMLAAAYAAREPLPRVNIRHFSHALPRAAHCSLASRRVSALSPRSFFALIWMRRVITPPEVRFMLLIFHVAFTRILPFTSMSSI